MADLLKALRQEMNDARLEYLEWRRYLGDLNRVGEVDLGVLDKAQARRWAFGAMNRARGRLKRAVKGVVTELQARQARRVQQTEAMRPKRRSVVFRHQATPITAYGCPVDGDGYAITA